MEDEKLWNRYLNVMITLNNQPTMPKWIIWLVIIVVLASLATATPSTTRSSSFLKKLKGNAKARATAMKENVKAGATAVKAGATAIREHVKKVGDRIKNSRLVGKVKGKFWPTTPKPPKPKHEPLPQERNFFAIVRTKHKRYDDREEIIECAGTVVAHDVVLTSSTCFHKYRASSWLNIIDVGVLVGLFNESLTKEVNAESVDIYTDKEPKFYTDKELNRYAIDVAKVNVPSKSFQDKISICPPFFWSPFAPPQYDSKNLAMVGLSCDHDRHSSTMPMDWQEVVMDITDAIKMVDKTGSAREHIYSVPTMNFLPPLAGHKSREVQWESDTIYDRLCENSGGPVFSTWRVNGRDDAHCLAGVVTDVENNHDWYWYRKSKNWQPGILFRSLKTLDETLNWKENEYKRIYSRE